MRRKRKKAWARKEEKKRISTKKGLWRSVQEQQQVKEEKCASKRARSHNSEGGKKRQKSTSTGEGKWRSKWEKMTFESPASARAVCLQTVDTLWTCRQRCWSLTALLVWVLFPQAVPEHSFPTMSSSISRRIFPFSLCSRCWSLSSTIPYTAVWRENQQVSHQSSGTWQGPVLLAVRAYRSVQGKKGIARTITQPK